MKDYVEICSDLQTANGHSRKDDSGILRNTGEVTRTGSSEDIPDRMSQAIRLAGVIIAWSQSQGESLGQKLELRMDKKTHRGL